MANSRREIWAQAAIAASVWSASEVVLGFLLHSYRVPFKGQVLTGIAIVILTALHKEWGGRGIIIRAALICALLKLLAPTPKIIGPVVAILVEGSLLELAIFFFGRTSVAYLFGGGMAMTWTFIQKIGKLLIFYGKGMIELYSEILTTFNNWAGIHISPILFLLVCSGGYFLLGSVFGLIGSRISVIPLEVVPQQKNHSSRAPKAGKVFARKNSITLIGIHALFLFTVLLLSQPTLIFHFSMAIYLGAGIILYRERLGKTKNVRIWIPVFLVMILSGLFLHQGEGFFSRGGFYTGLAMGFRAMFITFCVHFLIIEAANPKIRQLWKTDEEGCLFSAVKMAQTSFQAIEGTLEANQFLRHPFKSVHTLIGIGLGLEQSGEYFSPLRTIILTGEVNSGKTTLLQQVLVQREKLQQPVRGIIAEGVWQQGEKCGYDALFLPQKKRYLLCRKNFSSFLQTGQFGFNEEVFPAGEQLLLTEDPISLTVIDEIGRLELEGKGWATSLRGLLKGKNQVLIVVRRDLVNQVVQTFSLNNYVIVDTENSIAEQTLLTLINTFEAGRHLPC